MGKVTTITINTDASFHPKHKVGGYAFYIVCDEFKITKSGMFNTHPANSTEAEIMCIGNALATLLKRDDLPQSKYLIINTDCIAAMTIIRTFKNPLGTKVNGIWQRVISRVSSKKNEFRHVKAHSGVDDARSYVNDWCDRNAKEQMYKALKEKTSRHAK